MAYKAVLRIEQVRMQNLSGKAAHNNRKETPRFYADGRPHVDESRTKLNQCFKGSGDASKDVQDILDAYPLASKRTTKVCAEAILTANADYFDEICPKWREGVYTKKFKAWVNQSRKFMEDEFGVGVASCDLHLDEGAPHLHFIIVPVATYEQGYRHGSKEVTKVNYNRLIGDDAQVIAAARKAENPDLTKVGRLQTRYAKAVNNLGLERGLRYSNATHEDTQDYRKRLKSSPDDKPKAPKKRAVEESAGDKALKLIGKESEKDKADAQYEADLQDYKEDNKEYIKTLEAKAKQLERSKKRIKQLEDASERKQDKIMALEEKVTKITNELSLKKSEIDALRKAPMDTVAESLNYTGEITWKGAIDMVKEVGGLDYKDAVKFLYDNIGIDACKNAIKQNALVTAEENIEALSSLKLINEDRRLTKNEFAIKSELTKQLESINASGYRVTLFPSGDGATYTLNKRNDGSEELYSAERLLGNKLIAHLNYKNWHDKYNIFITPVDDNFYYVLVDDLSTDTLSKVKEKGYTPLQVLESSNGNYQAIIKVNKGEFEAEDVNAFFKEINIEYGDKNIRGLGHAFRAAGFQNMKDKHFDKSANRRPIVRLVEASKSLCNRAMERISEIADMTSSALTARFKKIDNRALKNAIPNINPSEFTGISTLTKASLDKEASGFYKAMQNKYGDEINLSTADFMLVKRLQKKGFSDSECAYTLLKNSPDLKVRHKAFERYLRDTLNNASMGSEYSH